MNLPEELQKLAVLRQNGTLTENEFIAAKGKLLAASAPPPLPNKGTPSASPYQKPVRKTSGCAKALLIGILGFVALMVIPIILRQSETPEETAARQEAAEARNAAEEEQKAQKEAAKAEKDKRIAKQNEEFKAWALKNTSVTDIAINGETTIFVTLSAEKYSNRDDVRVIAETIARWYGQRTGSRYVSCSVYYGNEVYAKGVYKAQ